MGGLDIPAQELALKNHLKKCAETKRGVKFPGSPPGVVKETILAALEKLHVLSTKTKASTSADASESSKEAANEAAKTIKALKEELHERRGDLELSDEMFDGAKEEVEAFKKEIQMLKAHLYDLQNPKPDGATGAAPTDNTPPPKQAPPASTAEPTQEEKEATEKEGAKLAMQALYAKAKTVPPKRPDADADDEELALFFKLKAHYNWHAKKRETLLEDARELKAKQARLLTTKPICRYPLKGLLCLKAGTGCLFLHPTVCDSEDCLPTWHPDCVHGEFGHYTQIRERNEALEAQAKLKFKLKPKSKSEKNQVTPDADAGPNRANPGNGYGQRKLNSVQKKNNDEWTEVKSKNKRFFPSSRPSTMEQPQPRHPPRQPRQPQPRHTPQRASKGLSLQDKVDKIMEHLFAGK